MGKSLNELMVQVCKFSDERGWSNTEPNHLLTSVMIELAELAEHFQWEASFSGLDNVKRKQIGYEIVDVLVYLLKIAARSEIDLDVAFQEKLEKLAQKYPVGSDYIKQKELYRKTGKNKLY